MAKTPMKKEDVKRIKEAEKKKPKSEQDTEFVKRAEKAVKKKQ